MNKLPDVAKETQLDYLSPLDWVGMQDIEMPIKLDDMSIVGKVSAFVSLDKTEARGIHMSRLYKITQDILSSGTLRPELLEKALEQFLATHQDLSSSAKICVQLQALIERTALVSANKAWRTYPVQLMAEHKFGKTRFFLEVTVTYSSTCPASAALARQLVQEKFKEQFSKQEDLKIENVYNWLGSTQGMVATPHAQRSFAVVQVEISKHDPLNFIDMINLIEEALQTPVQTVVKRQDEQEFALRNGQNLMFCEDAARRIKLSLNNNSKVMGFQGQVRHIESLHPHDAVSFFSSAQHSN